MPYTGPVVTVAPPISISTVSLESCGLAGRNIGNATPASVAIGTANLAIYVPFSLRQGVTVAKLWCMNGGTLNGNTDLAVYDESFAARINVTAAAMAGASTTQEFDCTDTYLPPGNYYFGLLNSGTTGTYFGWVSLPLCRLMGVWSQAVGAANLPDPMVPATMTALALVPIVGLICSPTTIL